MGTRGRCRGGGVPQDWVGCPKMANGLIGGTFLVFKTPLKDTLNKGLGEQERFTLEDVFVETQRLNKENVLWIDLTNTQRYYLGADVTAKEGFEYSKMAMAGHGHSPSKSQRDDFVRSVDDFLKKHPSGIVGVHCTHGFNRTGFLIAYYLMARRDYTAENAVAEFKDQRPPGIYRQGYVEELYELCKTGKQKPPKVEQPSWLSKNDDNDDASKTPSNSRNLHPRQQSSRQTADAYGPPKRTRFVSHASTSNGYDPYFAEDVYDNRGNSWGGFSEPQYQQRYNNDNNRQEQDHRRRWKNSGTMHGNMYRDRGQYQPHFQFQERSANPNRFINPNANSHHSNQRFRGNNYHTSNRIQMNYDWHSNDNRYRTFDYSNDEEGNRNRRF